MGAFSDYLQWRADVVEAGMGLRSGALHDLSFSLYDDSDFMDVVFEAEEDIGRAVYPILQEEFARRNIEWNPACLWHNERILMDIWCQNVHDAIEDYLINYEIVRDITNDLVEQIIEKDVSDIWNFESYPDEYFMKDSYSEELNTFYGVFNNYFD